MNFPVENRWSERGAPEQIEKVGSRPNSRSAAPGVDREIFQEIHTVSEYVESRESVSQSPLGGIILRTLDLLHTGMVGAGRQ